MFSQWKRLKPRSVEVPVQDRNIAVLLRQCRTNTNISRRMRKKAIQEDKRFALSEVDATYAVVTDEAPNNRKDEASTTADNFANLKKARPSDMAYSFADRPVAGGGDDSVMKENVLYGSS